MPKALEDKLRREAKQKHHLSGEHLNAYVYGGLRHMGWKPKRERTKELRHKREESMR